MTRCPDLRKRGSGLFFLRKGNEGRGEASAPTECSEKCGERADVGIGPYEDVTSSVVQVRVAGLQEVR